MMLAQSIYTIKYQDGFLGGVYKTSRHFVCGFSNKTDARLVKMHIHSRNLRLHYDTEFNRIIMPVDLNAKTSVNRKHITVKTDNFMKFAFYLGVNNVDLILIRKVEEVIDPYGQVYIRMINGMQVDILVNKAVSINKIEMDLSGQIYDYDTVLEQEINIDRNMFDM